MDMQRHVTIIAALEIAFSVIFLLVGIIAFVFFAGIGILSQDPEAIGVLGLLGTIGFVIMMVLGVPTLIAGIGLLKRQSWARILTIVVSCLYLPAIPIGTALGVYGLWVMTEKETIQLFAHGTSQPLPPVQPV
jgi:hypothetical protein